MTQSNLPELGPTPEKPASPVEFPRHSDPAADTEPLLHLHKMSTTAGLGSQDYVAINVTAILAVVFGLASILCALGYLLLIIPLVGIVTSLVALRQIRNSNGTQTGRALAWTGLLLAAGITIVIGGTRGSEVLQRRSNEQAISALSGNFGQDLANRQYEQAYDLFSADFHARVPLNEFKARLALLQQPGAPVISATEWNGLAEFSTDSANVESAASMIKLIYRDSTSDDDNPRLEAHFRRDPDGWRIDDIGQFFPTTPKPGDNSGR
jgi:hypothetical protein